MITKRYIKGFLLLIGLGSLFSSLACCVKASAETQDNELRHKFENILDISYTPDTLHRCTGWFTDMGSWMGFTLPEKDKWVNGFCGPFSLDMSSRYWIAKCAVNAAIDNDDSQMLPDSTRYYPGEILIDSHSGKGNISQSLCFVNANTALLRITSDNELTLSGIDWNPEVSLSLEGNTLVGRHPSGECLTITFPQNVSPVLTGNNYEAKVAKNSEDLYIAISFFPNDQEMKGASENVAHVFDAPEKCLQENSKRWNGYLKSVLRDDMPAEYDRIAAKAVVTLISNWRAHRGSLLHDGIVPSHAVGYFVGFWAWDTWRQCAAATLFEPELAKNSIRSMFDYQLDDGMIIDCIYTDASENNARDSKPPLSAWAVDEIFKATGDTLFVAEMYPQLLKYYKWWYDKRDHDGNGICEFGSTDGTLEAAAWESGMDNAIRFDDVKMLNNGKPDAWSMDQENVDLNSYLALEHRVLKKFADMLNLKFDMPSHQEEIAAHFFDPATGFYYDRRLKDGSFVTMPGCEAYSAIWTGVATPEHVKTMLPTLQDTTKFSTYIPFPTVAADNPKYDPRGYWRGPIWLDQTCFAILGLRNYGYEKEADEYTRQVFDRLEGLQGGKPIHENYDAKTGERLKAPHFSWSAAHLLLLYKSLNP